MGFRKFVRRVKKTVRNPSTGRKIRKTVSTVGRRSRKTAVTAKRKYKKTKATATAIRNM